jgi:plasmid stabilization system protein ParE
MPRVVGFHPEALAEVVAAAHWYRERSPAAGAAFQAEIDRAIDRIVRAPERYPPYVAGTRRFLLRRFPYAVIYRIGNPGIEIVAVAHGRRRPGHWRQR